MEKTINIQNEANINATGKLHSKNCKPIICLETGEVFTSVTDAAKANNVYSQNMSMHLTGKRRSINGKHFCYLSRSMESLNAIVSRLRETSTMEEDARKWREYQAEQEAIRKAEEKRIADELKAKEEYEAKVVKVTSTIERRYKMRERIEEQLNDIDRRIIEAEKEYEVLTGKAYEKEDVI